MSINQLSDIVLPNGANPLLEGGTSLDGGGVPFKNVVTEATGDATDVVNRGFAEGLIVTQSPSIYLLTNRTDVYLNQPAYIQSAHFILVVPISSLVVQPKSDAVNFSNSNSFSANMSVTYNGVNPGLFNIYAECQTDTVGGTPGNDEISIGLYIIRSGVPSTLPINDSFSVSTSNGTSTFKRTMEWMIDLNNGDTVMLGALNNSNDNTMVTRNPMMRITEIH